MNKILSYNATPEMIQEALHRLYDNVWLDDLHIHITKDEPIKIELKGYLCIPEVKE